MWFDVDAALAEIMGETQGFVEHKPAATSAALATAPRSVAIVAGVAASVDLEPETTNCETGLSLAGIVAPEGFPHGISVGGHPLTWTGRVVNLDEWRRLSDWERHGPRGKQWNGLTGQWEDDGGEV